MFKRVERHPATFHVTRPYTRKPALPASRCCFPPAGTVVTEPLQGSCSTCDCSVRSCCDGDGGSADSQLLACTGSVDFIAAAAMAISRGLHYRVTAAAVKWLMTQESWDPQRRAVNSPACSDTEVIFEGVSGAFSVAKEHLSHGDCFATSLQEREDCGICI